MISPKWLRVKIQFVGPIEVGLQDRAGRLGSLHKRESNTPLSADGHRHALEKKDENQFAVSDTRAAHAPDKYHAQKKELLPRTDTTP